jgi:hypothetical protein
MKLYELAYACRLYQGPFDDAYRSMRNALGENPDLASPAQQNCLLRFLNDWRCRIPEKNFPALKDRLQQWATRWIPELPDASKDIRCLNDSERAQIGNGYQELLKLGLGLHFQDTAAAKTLHALRPNTLPMWDAEIKNWFSSQRSPSRGSAGQIYSDFLLHVAQEISALEVDVKRLAYSLGDVPQLVQCPDFSVVKLVDQYNWITITSGHEVPRRDQLEQWLRWASSSNGATPGR